MIINSWNGFDFIAKWEQKNDEANDWQKTHEMKVRIVELMIEVNRMYLNEMILESKSLISYSYHPMQFVQSSLFIDENLSYLFHCTFILISKLKFTQMYHSQIIVKSSILFTIITYMHTIVNTISLCLWQEYISNLLTSTTHLLTYTCSSLLQYTKYIVKFNKVNYSDLVESDTLSFNQFLPNGHTE